MAAKRNQHRISSVLTRLACGFCTFFLAVILSTNSNPSGPNKNHGGLDSHLPVVVAKVEIPVGTRIIAEHLTVVQFPHNVTPQGAFATTDKLIDRVTTVRISAKEPITESRLAPVGDAGGLSSVIPEGFRAMTVRVDDVVGISGFIMPGTLVDIVVVTQPPKGTGQQEMISKIVLQNIKVIASGQNIYKPKNDRVVERAVRAVTLQVTPEEAEKLALASSEGNLQLVMRTR